MPQQVHDEETSSSEDSVYFTPEVSFTHSIIPAISSTPAATQVTLSDFQSVYQTPKKTSVRSFLNERLSSSGRKLILDAMNEKENISCSKLAKSSVSVSLRHPASTPLKCVTNTATSARISSDIPVTVKSHTKYNSVIDTNILSTKLNNVKKSESRSRRSFLQRLGVSRKSTSKYKVLKESLVSDVSLNDSDEAIVIRVPKKNYGTICCEKSNIESSDIYRNNVSSSNLLPVESMDDLSSRLFDYDKILLNDQAKWKFSRLYPNRSVFNKLRISPMKRLLRRSAACVYSFHEKYIKKLFVRKYQPLKPTVSCSEIGVKEKPNDPSSISISKDIVEQLSFKLDSVIGVEHLIKQMVLKLDSLENEVKELRNLLKNNNAREVIVCPPPPPPPPPPPLPNFLTTAALKRKVELTTPENDPLAKRPPRMMEQKTQFSITVEDLKKVKLRKTGNSKIVEGTIKDKSSVRDISFHSATISKRKRRSHLNNKKELSEIATQLLLSPRKKMTDQVENNTVLSSNSLTVTPVKRTSIVYDETPARTNRISPVSRSFKRKEWSGESPVKKRLNSGCSSPVCYDSHSDAAE